MIIFRQPTGSTRIIPFGSIPRAQRHSPTQQGHLGTSSDRTRTVHPPKSRSTAIVTAIVDQDDDEDDDEDEEPAFPHAIMDGSSDDDDEQRGEGDIQREEGDRQRGEGVFTNMSGEAGDDGQRNGEEDVSMMDMQGESVRHSGRTTMNRQTGRYRMTTVSR